MLPSNMVEMKVTGLLQVYHVMLDDTGKVAWQQSVHTGGQVSIGKPSLTKQRFSESHHGEVDFVPLTGKNEHGESVNGFARVAALPEDVRNL